MLQIFLYGKNEKGFLDIYPGTVLDMESLSDIFDEDLTTGEYSLPVEIPWTENNRRLMGFAERLENGQQPQNYWVCDVYDRGWPELVHAKITLLDKSGSINYSTGKFNASISGTKGLFGTAIKNKNLQDLPLGGIIAWADPDECRKYATDHMQGLYPGREHIAFAPVAIEKFFSEEDKHLTSGNTFEPLFLAKDTVNYIISTGSGANDWLFGRPDPTTPTVPTSPGDDPHMDYRTIPFLNFKYVLRQAFEYVGYTVTGEILSSTDFDDLYIFNNFGIEFYINSIAADYRRYIKPWEHVPNMPLVDFFKAVFSFFNIYPVFSQGSQVELLYRNKTLANRKILDLTDRCGPTFSSTYKEASGNDGYTLAYQWDEKDNYRGDRVKDLEGKTKVGTVATVADLASIDSTTLGRPATTDDIAFVVAENMWYQVANNFNTIPLLWDANSEELGDFVKGAGDRTVNLGLGTLCTYVEFDPGDALNENRYRVGTSQLGSCWNWDHKKITNPFSLRLFYIKKILQPNGNIIPVSFSNNRNADNDRIVPYSLALGGDDGMAANFHDKWQTVNNSNQSTKITFAADKKMMEELAACNTVAVNNILFLPYKTESKLPLQSTVDIELVPI